jgi:antitoxin (DNA-binding transcriptional repressor) of toxin-antitoxin stability system
MESQTVDINDAEGNLKELVKQVAEGARVVLSDGDKPVAQLVPVGQRIAGLHAGVVWTSEDFDDPLPDEFWTEGK